MIQGINSDYDSYYTLTSAASTSVSSASASANEKTAQGSQSTRTDTVEISPQARAAMQQADTIVSVGGKTSSQNSSEQQGDSVTKQSAAVKANAAAVASASTSSQPVLTNLTQAELDELVSKGTITAAQEQAELARRAVAEQQSQVDTASQKTQIPVGENQNTIEGYNSQAQNIGSGVPSGSLMNRVA